MFDVVQLNSETWLICGGRSFSDRQMFDRAMGDLMELKGCPSHIIHGAAKGADAMADEFGKRMGVRVTAFHPNWKEDGSAAGPLRNELMLQQKPDLVVAFPGGRGTADMVERARKASVDVAEIKATANVD